MRNIETINAEIAQVKEDMSNVRGNTTEVYARIVGYYRSVRNWNKGKKEEYNHRKLFVTDPEEVLQHTVHIEQEEALSLSKGGASYVEIYTRETCPNCPPVTEYCNTLAIAVKPFNVDTKEGFAKACKHEILSTPTVIFFNALGEELGRAHSVSDVQALQTQESLRA